MAPLPDDLAAQREAFPQQFDHTTGKVLLPASTWQWLDEKHERDKVPENLWRVRGKLYDLTPFMDSHPGGREWLEMLRGTDCTTAFETHHIEIAKAEALLRKYEAKRASSGSVSSSPGAVDGYLWEQDEFFAELRELSAKELRTRNGNGPTLTMHGICLLATTCWALSFLWALQQPGVLSVLAFGFFGHTMLGIGHNFLHQRNTIWRYAMDLTAFAHHEWRLSHAISHHLYPNLGVDVEASLMEPWASFVRDRPYFLRGYLRLAVSIIFLLLVALVNMTRLLASLGAGPNNMRKEHLLKLVPAAILIYQHGWTGLVVFMAGQTVAFALLVLSSFPVHRSIYGWTPGCEKVHPEAETFSQHIFLSTQDYHADGMGLFTQVFFAGTFNNHIIHHLLPTVDVSKQRFIRPIFLDLVKKYNMPYQVRSFNDLLKGMIRVHCRGGADDLCYEPPIKHKAT